MRDPWNVKLDLPQHSPLLPDANNTVFLINDAVDNDGDLFAFTAEIHHISPIWFQIWRPVLVPADSYELIAYRQVIPSVEEQFEDVRFTMFFVVCYIAVQLIYLYLSGKFNGFSQHFDKILFSKFLARFFDHHCTSSLAMLTSLNTGG